jgi:hypothetical protein
MLNKLSSICFTCRSLLDEKDSFMVIILYMIFFIVNSVRIQIVSFDLYIVKV